MIPKGSLESIVSVIKYGLALIVGLVFVVLGLIGYIFTGV